MKSRRTVERSVVHCPNGMKIETDVDWNTLDDFVGGGFGKSIIVSDGCYIVDYWLSNDKRQVKFGFEFVILNGEVAAHRRIGNLRSNGFYFLFDQKINTTITTLEEAERFLKLLAFK